MKACTLPLTILLLALLFALIGVLLPNWLVFLSISIIAKAIVVSGVVLLMRTNIVSFGQGLYYCIGAYCVGLAVRYLEISDAFLLLMSAMLSGAVISVLLGLFMCRYREIFFAMFSLALSMILFGALSKSEFLGSTDGFNVVSPSYLGFMPAPEHAKIALYFLSCFIAVGVACAIHIYMQSPLGYAAQAVRENETRLEYLGVSPNRIVYLQYVLSSMLASIGGGLMALALGHIGPEMTYWTQSGEFIFIALFGGAGNALAPFIGTGIFELLRTYALEFMPNAWQFILGATLIIIILFLPNGICGLLSKKER